MFKRFIWYLISASLIYFVFYKFLELEIFPEIFVKGFLIFLAFVFLDIVVRFLPLSLLNLAATSRDPLKDNEFISLIFIFVLAIVGFTFIPSLKGTRLHLDFAMGAIVIPQAYFTWMKILDLIKTNKKD